MEEKEHSDTLRDRITTITALVFALVGIFSLPYALFFGLSFGMDYVTVFTGTFLLTTFTIPEAIALWKNPWYNNMRADMIVGIVFSLFGFLLYSIDLLLYGFFLPLAPFPIAFALIVIVSIFHLYTGPHPQEPKPPTPEGYQGISEMYDGCDD